MDYEAIIIGAGILGSALAVALGKQNRRVLLVERDLKEPDRIVGELLQPGGVAALYKLGLQGCLDDIDSVEEKGYEILYRGERVKIAYKSEYPGRSFHHGRFVMKLRRTAMGQKNVRVMQATANSLLKNAITGQVIGVKVTVGEYPASLFAPLVFIADGCFSKFRRTCIDKQATSKSSFVGLVLKDAALPAPNHGHVVLGNSPPVLLYQISTHDTRILVDIPGRLPSGDDLKTYLETKVCPDLPVVLQGPFREALLTQRPRSMPNAWLPPSLNKQPGLILIGDAMNMRHPLTGGGMTVALTDVVLLRDLLDPQNVASFEDTRLVLDQMTKFHWQRKSLSSVINVLAQALYSLFAANDDHLLALQEGCIRYFQLGGRCVQDPVGLLSGVLARPLLLALHFYAVAFYAILLLFSRARLVDYPRTILQSFLVLQNACAVFLPVVFSELLE